MRIAFGLVCLVVFTAVQTGLGCRHVPFYRMTKKASQSFHFSREGIAAYERGDFATAEERLAKAYELNDSDVETCRYYGETLWQCGKRMEAMDVLRAAADKHGPAEAQSSLYRSLGEKALEVDRPDQAVLWANKIIDLTPKSSYGWELRGKAYHVLDKPKDALADFQRAVHFSVDDRSLLHDIASIQNELSDYDNALATWQYLEQLYPTNREPAVVFAGKGQAYLGLGLLADAQNAYEVAVRFAPHEPEYRVKLAQTALARGDFQRANSVIAESKAIMPNQPEFQRLYQQAGRNNEQVAEIARDSSRLR